jgi:Ca2+/H+ antiporter, TMEM165/GDT1 family
MRVIDRSFSSKLAKAVVACGAMAVVFAVMSTMVAGQENNHLSPATRGIPAPAGSTEGHALAQKINTAEKELEKKHDDPKIAAEHHFTLADVNHDELLDRDEFKSLYLHMTAEVGGFGVVGDEHEHGPFAGVSHKGLVIATQALGFWSAFINSVAMIIVTELGDKTFFIAAIMAMRNPRGVVFAGAAAALVVMTVLSTMIGFALPHMLPEKYTHLAASGLFAYFGYKLLTEAYEMYREGKGGSNDTNEELEEVEEEMKANTVLPTTDKEGDSNGKLSADRLVVLTQAFTITFLAEWGDRSQIATIALAAHKDPYGVTLGGCIGHCMCTGLAVMGGRYLAGKIPERTVLFSGGVLFVLFAFHAFFFG